MRASKITQQVSNTQGPAEDSLYQVVGMRDQHDQHDVHAVQMEHSKIIKNIVQRTDPIILENINQVRCKATFTAFSPCRNRGRATSDRAEADAERTKGTPGDPVYRNRPSPQREDSQERVVNGSRGKGAFDAQRQQLKCANVSPESLARATSVRFRGTQEPPRRQRHLRSQATLSNSCDVSWARLAGRSPELRL